MIKNEIEKLKLRLYKMLQVADIGNDEVIKVSQELDELILKYYRETVKINK